MSNFYKNNREELFQKLEEEKFMITLFSGEPPIRQGDQNYPFTPSRNFFYLTGLDRPKFILTILKNLSGEKSETLFIERPDELKARWDGAFLTSEKAKEISGVDTIKYLDEFEEVFSKTLFFNKIENLYLDLENRYFKSTTLATKFAKKIQLEYPYVNIKNVYEPLAVLRTFKKPIEIENMKKAIDITKQGIESILKNAKPNQMEYEVEANFDFELKKNGVKEKAFETICAGGENATTLHYQENNCIVKENNLVLLDLGASYNYYNADISRTFPINKKFTERQKTLYNIVLNAQILAIENIKPGVKITDLQQLVKDYYFEKLSEIGLVSKKEDVDKYYIHNLGHPLGLETHDVCKEGYEVLEENVVVTVEPGLYIPEEGIGIRIEDDVLVTKDGFEVLSKDIIKTVEDIESFMEKYNI